MLARCAGCPERARKNGRSPSDAAFGLFSDQRRAHPPVRQHDGAAGSLWGVQVRRVPTRLGPRRRPGPDGTELHLRPKAFALLQYVLDNPGQLLGWKELLDALWPAIAVTDEFLTRCVVSLRHAFGERAGNELRTVPKRGSMLIAEVRHDDPPRRRCVRKRARKDRRPRLLPRPTSRRSGKIRWRSVDSKRRMGKGPACSWPTHWPPT